MANQNWTLTPAGELRSYANKCLEVANFGTTNGTKVQSWDCWGGDNEKWSFTPAGEIFREGDARNRGELLAVPRVRF